MEFAQPHALWLLLALPVLGWWLHRSRPRAISYSSFRLLHGVMPATDSRLWLQIIAPLTVMALLIVGMARPRWPDEGSRMPAESVAVQLLLDVSGSMAEKDFVIEGKEAARLDAARLALEHFIAGMPVDRTGSEEPLPPGRTQDLVGLLTFAAHAEDIVPPTLTHSSVLDILESTRPKGTPPESSTNVGDALAQGLALLGRAAPRTKVAILLSDGEHNIPSEVSAGALRPREAAQIARGLGVRIHTIYVGPSDSEAEQAMRDVATLTGGRAFVAHDTAALLEVSKEIDAAERTRFESFHYYRYYEAYPWIGAAAIVLSLASLAGQGTKWLMSP